MTAATVHADSWPQRMCLVSNSAATASHYHWRQEQASQTGNANFPELLASVGAKVRIADQLLRSQDVSLFRHDL